MQTPRRKPGKYTGLKADPYITLEKKLELENKLERLKNSSRPRAIIEVKRLAADGDFSENAAYQIAKGRLRGINQRILYIEDHLRRAMIIGKPTDKNSISIGSRVTLEKDGKQKTYLILGSSESDPGAGIISHNSPLGSALIGRSAGEIVKLDLGDKINEHKIIKIC